MYRKQFKRILRNSASLYGYLVGMVVEVAATLVLMGVGLLISMVGSYLWK